jgi:hypothetical protein
MCTWSMERQSRSPGNFEMEEEEEEEEEPKLNLASTRGVIGVDIELWRRRLARLENKKIKKS